MKCKYLDGAYCQLHEELALRCEECTDWRSDDELDIGGVHIINDEIFPPSARFPKENFAGLSAPNSPPICDRKRARIFSKAGGF